MRNALSFDIEDWFHILELENGPKINDWDLLESRVTKNTERILELLDSHKVKGTFFILGWVAEKFPSLINDIACEGHEIGSHGYSHKLIHTMTEVEFEEDLIRSIEVIELASEKKVVGFRSPGFSITSTTPWAFDVIAKVGLRYDSSIFPAMRSHGGLIGAESFPTKLLTANAGDLIEFPISVIGSGRLAFCIFGGGYFRLAPYFLISKAIRSKNRQDSPVAMYFHPRDFDVSQPRLSMGWYRDFKSYVNISSSYKKLDKLLTQFEFAPIGDVLADVGLLKIE